MSVLPVSSLMGKVMLIPSKLAMRSSVPQSWAKASRILGWLHCYGQPLSCEAVGLATHDLIFHTNASCPTEYRL